MKLVTALSLVLLVAVVPPAVAQIEIPKAPELKKLDVFVGSWNLQGEMKPGSMGTGGSMSETETCNWMEGGYFLVCNVDFKSTMGNGTGTAYMSYDSNEKMYTYDAFNSMGEAEHARGALEGDTWTWSSEEKMGGQSMKAHFIIKMPPTSTNSYTFRFDMSPDGSTWNTVMDGKATKQK
jgi:Protein of unknown function (DUF1579)